MKINPFFKSGLLTTLIITSCHAAAFDNKTILKNLTIIDGTDARPIYNASIIIEDNIITSVTTEQDEIDESGAKVLDLNGKFAIPGLIDAHVHLTDSEDTSAGLHSLDAFFKMGVTSVRDMTGNGTALKKIQNASINNEISRPKVYFSALVGGEQLFNDPRVAGTAGNSTPGKVPWMPLLDNNTDIEKLVEQAKAFGVTGLKFYGDISGELIEAATAEAEAQDLRVWSHIAVFPATPLEVISAGVDSVSHADMLALADFTTLPRYTESFKLFSLGAKFTKSAPYGTNNLELYQLMITNEVILEPTLSHFKEKGIESVAKYAKAAYQNGVTIGVGTDNDGTVLSEIKLLMDHAGMTAHDAMIAATANNAEILGMEDEIGTIEEDKIADLVILSANPLDNIDNLSSINYVIKGGVVHTINSTK